MYLDLKHKGNLLALSRSLDYILKPSAISNYQNESILFAFRYGEENTLFDQVDNAIAKHPLNRLLVQQKKAYESFQKSSGIIFDNVFDTSILFHSLRSETGKKFRCTWLRESLDWDNSMFNDRFSGSFILNKMASEANLKSDLMKNSINGNFTLIPIEKGKSFIQLLPSGWKNK